MLENILDLEKHINLQITEADLTPTHKSKYIHPNAQYSLTDENWRPRTYPQVFKREGNLTRKGELSEWQPVFIEITGTRRKWHDIFKYFFPQSRIIFYFPFKFKFKTILHVGIKKFEYPFFACWGKRQEF